MSNPAVNTTLDHLFRHEYGKLVSLFTNRYSPHLIDKIEDAVQEALYKAAKIWSYQPMPENPSAWIYRVANNQLIDFLRKDKRNADWEHHESAIIAKETTELELPEERALVDDQLRMIFACCHPAMKPTEQLMLSLKLLCGLSIKEIARALLKNEEAAKKAITRAKKKFKEEVGELVVPKGKDIESRMSEVLQVIYLLFNEGYKATEGEKLIKGELCEEAIRLGFLLTNEPSCNNGELNALISMMLFKAARFPARMDKDGNLLTLEHQDRTLYDTEYIEWAWKFLKESSMHDGSSVYQLEAAIAAYYTTAENYEVTNWKVILGLYDSLVRLKPVPVVQMSRVVVLSMVEGPAKALEVMESLEREITGNQSFNALKADLYASLGEWSKARVFIQKAIAQAQNVTEKRFLEQKLQSWIGK